MAKRIVYVNPGDLIEIRAIQDPELPRNAGEWSAQIHSMRDSILLQYRGHRHVSVADPLLRVDSIFTS